MPTSIQDPLKSGEMLGAYEITEVIAVGHSNAIYAARHKQTDRSVAVRILLAELGTDPLEVKRSVNAARVLGRISHENVVTVYDFGMSSTGLPYTVMELINGRTMQSLLKEEGTLSALRLRRLFGQICLAMSAVHAKQIVHRDLKPANFLISKSEEEKVTIIDFSASKTMEAGRDNLTQVGELVGTPDYMSPEQCMGQPVDAHSDIYAIGCCMFEAMTGAKPFAGATATDTMSKHVSNHPTISADLEPEYKGLTAVILKCLEKKPEDRYQSMSELHRDVSGQTVKTKPSKNLRNI